jgi:protein gp37
VARTKIEWATHVWNPVTGCTPVSEGCRNCYARRISKRLVGRFGYPVDEPFRVTLHEDRLKEPLTWKGSRRVFVCSMGDLFHDDVPDEFIARVWWVMGQCAGYLDPSRYRGHTFLVLTKRPERMREWLKGWSDQGTRKHWIESFGEVYDWMSGPKHWPDVFYNVWLGVTAENQKRADERIPVLLQVPAAKRFVSVEPMLGPVDLSKWLFNLRIPCSCGFTFDSAQASVCEHGGTFRCPVCGTCKCDKESKWRREGKLLDGEPGWDWLHPAVQRQPLIDWVICGGETGPGARPVHPEWVRSLRDRCQDAGVPFFFKSWGEWFPREMWEYNPYLVLPDDEFAYRNSKDTQVFEDGPDMYPVHRVGKKKAGRILDGCVWDEMPGGSRHG